MSATTTHRNRDGTGEPIGRALPASHADIRRRLLACAGLGLLTISVSAAAPTTIKLDVVVDSYLDRPIFDIYIDKQVGDRSGAYPDTGGSIVMRVKLALGPKTISWRLGGPQGAHRNGDTVVAKSAVALAAPAPRTAFLALHIYPDDTVELLNSVAYPEPTRRGKIDIARLEKKHAT